MAPGAISNVQNNGSDVDLTATAIDHKMEEAHAAAAPASNGQKAVYQELDASKLTYSFTQSPLQVPEPGVTANGNKSICTDHMLVANWSAETGWSAPEIKPYGPFMLSPTASVLHYATECFEGMKAYRGHDGKLRLFRPDCNAERLLMSSVRISLPSFPPSEVEKLVKAFMAVDGPKWLPRDRPGSFIYIRPTLIGTHSQLGMDAPAGGMRLHTSPADMVRAWAGGFGYAKVGANYGPSLLATSEAKTRGFHQILWLYGEEGLCTEAGASNFFVLWKNKDTGRTELVTAPLGDKIILDGVTRRSVLQLVRERCADEIDVVERKYTIDEVLEADAEGRLVESFASGTAYFVCPISLIHHRGKDVNFPMGKKNEGGDLTLKVKNWLKDIMYGREDHPWGYVVPEEQ
ncbi:hypothetical protein G7054_g14906 [Neopestalotiopsis clavispora]|nr:hypothetical protein G7054_g14906 [Neopestalotiopsis clavispora]